MIDHNSYKPLYRQLADYLVANIKEGTWPVGVAIPSEPELTEQFQVSRNTVRSALRKLEQDGLIYRVPGKGTFVATTKLEISLGRLTGFSEDVRAMGMVPRYKILEITTMPATAKIAAKLQMAPDSEVIFVYRLALASDLPYIVVKSYLPKRWFELRGLDVAKDISAGGSFYNLLENRYGVRLGKSTITITASTANADEARLLHCNVGDPVLINERVTLTHEDDKPIEYTIGAGHPKRHQWTTTLTRLYENKIT